MVRNIYASINKKNKRKSGKSQTNKSQAKRPKFIILNEGSDVKKSNENFEELSEKDSNKPVDFKNYKENHYNKHKKKQKSVRKLKDSKTNISDQEDTFKLNLEKKDRKRSGKIGLGLGYYLGGQFMKAQKSSSKKGETESSINITDNLMKVSRNTDRNKSFDFRENKYHYLLSSFSKNKPRSRVPKGFERRTEIIPEKESLSKRGKFPNYTSMNYYSSPVDNLYTKDKPNKLLLTPISRTSNKDYKIKIFSGKRKQEVLEKSEIGDEEYQVTQKENLEEKKRRAKIQEYLTLLEESNIHSSEFERQVKKNMDIFKNWKDNSMAEFFEFRSTKELYKIKVSLIQIL